MNKLNYPTWLVPLDIALQLKEIAFNKDCAFYYDERLLRISPYHDEEFSTTNWNDKRYFRDCVSLPTWEQVFAWFREKGYESYIRLESHSHFDEGNYYYFEITKPNLYRINQLDWQGDFDDYNEVQEALVKALIRTYKQEQLK
jgi:hypothetical protein|nr:MAG TPA: hypothetical protein [Caudoviricetes sp.]